MPSRRHHAVPPVRDPTLVERAALQWVTRCDRGLTAEQQAEFETWLTQDPLHAELFSEFDGTFALIEHVQAPVAASASAINAHTVSVPSDVVSGSGDGETPRPVTARKFGSRKAWLPLSLAAAAAVAISYLGWWRPIHYSGALGTEVGALRTVTLPDKSIVQLNTDSAVSIAFSPTERRVRLVRGEVHFTVAKNPSRPFIVDAGDVAVRAVGTAFNVRLRNDSVDVLVTEGKVRVGMPSVSLRSAAAPVATGNTVSTARPALIGTGVAVAPSVASDAAPIAVESVRHGNSDVFLTAGHRLSVRVPPPFTSALVNLLERERRVIVLEAEEIRRELAWKERRLDFESAPLAEIVAEFNRYNRSKLVIGDARLAAERFGGSFKPDDSAGFVRMLRENFDIVVEYKGNETVLKFAP